MFFYFSYFLCNQPLQTLIYKMGGGGNRASWRIQIRRPPNGEHGVWDAFRLLPVPVRLQKPPTAAALPADPCAHSPRGRPNPPIFRLLADFSPIKNPSKI